MFCSGIMAAPLLLLMLVQSAAEESARQQVAEARAQAFDGRYEEALEGFRRALAFQPEDPVLHYYVGMTLYKLERFKPARSAFQRAIQLEASFPEPFLWLARVEMDLGEAESARTWVERGLEKFPRHEELNLLRERLAVP